MAGDQPTVAATFDERAGNYSRNEWHRCYAEQLVAQASLQTGQHVLDAGVGTGFAAAAIARAVGSAGRVVGVDVSQGMLDRARAALDAFDMAWVELRQADATDLRDVPEKAFDAVICSAALLYMPVDEALAEWRRLLKPGGIVAFSTMQPGSPRAGALFRQCARAFGVVLEDPSEPLGSVDACRRALDRAGFGDIHVVPGHVELSAADLALAWDANLRSAAHGAVRVLGEADLDLLRRQYEALLSAVPDGQEYSVERAAVLYAFGRR
ncbi:MAG: methyltransferase domain-containing protein [Vicinamibacteraceae bacterium]